MWHLFISGFILFIEAIAVLSACHALFVTRTTQGTIAWVVGLVAFPYVGIPLYWLFGARRYDRYAASMKEAIKRHQGEVEEAAAILEHYQVPPEDTRLSDRYRSATGIAKQPFLSGNALKLLIDGEATFDAIVGAIEEAKHSILVQFYIVHDDTLGQRLSEAVRRKAKEGVHVHFMFDGWGSKDLSSEYIDELKEAGVKVAAFDRPSGLRKRFELNFRNHRKIVVVDSRVAFVGGHNVGNEYLGKDPRFGRWRDTHVQVEGPAVLPIALVFAADWHFAKGHVTPPQIDQVSQKPSNIPVLTLATGASDEFERCTLFFMHLITSAQHRLWIASPYFVPDEGIINALQLAALRGVEIRILLPLKPDHKLVWLASFTFLEEMVHPNISIYRYKEGFLHQKVVLVDDDFAAIGTANFDNRSFRLNFEITLAMADPGFASQVKTMLEEDFTNSRLAEPDEYHSKPLWFRIAAKVARLLAPIL